MKSDDVSQVSFAVLISWEQNSNRVKAEVDIKSSVSEYMGFTPPRTAVSKERFHLAIGFSLRALGSSREHGTYIPVHNVSIKEMSSLKLLLVL